MGGVGGGGVDAGLCDRVGLLPTLLARGYPRHLVSTHRMIKGMK